MKCKRCGSDMRQIAPVTYTAESGESREGVEHHCEECDAYKNARGKWDFPPRDE